MSKFRFDNEGNIYGRFQSIALGRVEKIDSGEQPFMAKTNGRSAFGRTRVEAIQKALDRAFPNGAPWTLDADHVD